MIWWKVKGSHKAAGIAIWVLWMDCPSSGWEFVHKNKSVGWRARSHSPNPHEIQRECKFLLDFLATSTMWPSIQDPCQQSPFQDMQCFVCQLCCESLLSRNTNPMTRCENGPRLRTTAIKNLCGLQRLPGNVWVHFPSGWPINLWVKGPCRGVDNVGHLNWHLAQWDISSCTPSTLKLMLIRYLSGFRRGCKKADQSSTSSPMIALLTTYIRLVILTPGNYFHWLQHRGLYPGCLPL